SSAWAVPPDLQGASADRVKRLGGQRPWSPHWNTTAASTLQAVVPRLNAPAAHARTSPCPPMPQPPHKRRAPGGARDASSPLAPLATAGAASARRPAGAGRDRGAVRTAACWRPAPPRPRPANALGTFPG